MSRRVSIVDVSLVRPQLFKRYRCTAPLLRSYVGDGLGKCPAMPGKILRVVLTLAVGMIHWGGENARAVLPRPFVVTVRVRYTHHYQVRAVCWHASFGQHDAPVRSEERR